MTYLCNWKQRNQVKRRHICSEGLCVEKGASDLANKESVTQLAKRTSETATVPQTGYFEKGSNGSWALSPSARYTLQIFYRTSGYEYVDAW